MRKRGRLQGLINVLRFNWPVYALSSGVLIAGLLIRSALPVQWHLLADAALFLVAAQLLLVLLATTYAYDLSGFYRLDWLPDESPPGERILNISAGFDETTILLRARYPKTVVIAYDFYDPEKHTEPSIRRARKAFPAAPGTRAITATKIPEPDNAAELVCLILAAHEIRSAVERQAFFRELRRILKPGGYILLVEHLRDLPNVLAYNVGALHFFSRRQWQNDIQAAGLAVQRQTRLNLFISAMEITVHPEA